MIGRLLCYILDFGMCVSWAVMDGLEFLGEPKKNARARGGRPAGTCSTIGAWLEIVGS
jgi:hypothetical protein